MTIANACPMVFAGRNDNIKFDRRQVADHSRKGETETRNGIPKPIIVVFPVYMIIRISILHQKNYF